MSKMPNKVVSVDPEGDAWWAYLAPRLEHVEYMNVELSDSRPSYTSISPYTTVSRYISLSHSVSVQWFSH